MSDAAFLSPKLGRLHEPGPARCFVVVYALRTGAHLARLGVPPAVETPHVELYYWAGWTVADAVGMPSPSTGTRECHGATEESIKPR